MSRELKFRAWDSNNNVMVELGWTGKPQFMVNHGVWVLASEPTKLQVLDKIQHLIPMQSTGLKDKNGIEIYEGDIVKRTKMEPGAVEYNASLGCYSLDGDSLGSKILYAFKDGIKDCKVIGNIYENPELLS